jgi:archaellum component FlaF (FlaF/FlaG flagellin family)
MKNKIKKIMSKKTTIIIIILLLIGGIVFISQLSTYSKMQEQYTTINENYELYIIEKNEDLAQFLETHPVYSQTGINAKLYAQELSDWFSQNTPYRYNTLTQSQYVKSEKYIEDKKLLSINSFKISQTLTIIGLVHEIENNNKLNEQEKQAQLALLEIKLQNIKDATVFDE